MRRHVRDLGAGSRPAWPWLRREPDETDEVCGRGSPGSPVRPAGIRFASEADSGSRPWRAAVAPHGREAAPVGSGRERNQEGPSGNLKHGASAAVCPPEHPPRPRPPPADPGAWETDAG